MARRSHPEFLRLVHSEDSRSEAHSASARLNESQESFLPSSLPNTIIFLAWGKASADDLMDVFALSKPKLFLDLRLAPRFDLAHITRKRFFDLLKEKECQYVDLLGSIAVDNLNDALLNPVLIASHAAKFAEKLRTPNRGPLVFVHDDD